LLLSAAKIHLFFVYAKYYSKNCFFLLFLLFFLRNNIQNPLIQLKNTTLFSYLSYRSVLIFITIFLHKV